MNFDEFVKKECPGLAEGAALPHGIQFKDIEAEFSRDPDWPKVKDDPRWLNHLAETLNAWRVRVGH